MIGDNNGFSTASIDLHVHLRGTLQPQHALQLAAKKGIILPPGVIGPDGRYDWQDFGDFLRTYELVGQVLADPDDLGSVAERYLKMCAAERTVYAEFMLSPGRSVTKGSEYLGRIDAVARGIERARKLAGINATIIVTCVRHHGPDEATRVADLVASNPHPIVVGFGMTGDERQFEPSAFVPAFRVADEAGLNLTAHVGEWLGPSSVIATVEALDLSRVGHGIRAIEDKGVLRELAQRGTAFEVCLSSNAMLGVAPLETPHALLTLMDAGCRVTLATDDPAYFATSPFNEYNLARQQLALSDSDLAGIAENSILAAFCNEITKAELLQAAKRTT